MKGWMLAPLMLGALFSAGCAKVVSLQPLYSADDPAPTADLVGRWAEVDGKSICIITAAEDGLVVSYLPDEGSQPSGYRGRLVAAGNTMFLDLSPAEDLPDFAIAGHWPLKLEHQGNELVAWVLDDDWVENQCGAGRLACVTVKRPKGDDAIVITSPPAVLQKVLLDPAAFRDPGRFRKLD